MEATTNTELGIFGETKKGIVHESDDQLMDGHCIEEKDNIHKLLASRKNVGKNGEQQKEQNLSGTSTTTTIENGILPMAVKEKSPVIVDESIRTVSSSGRSLGNALSTLVAASNRRLTATNSGGMGLVEPSSGSSSENDMEDDEVEGGSDEELPPKRPLSAYNLFFHLERQRIIDASQDGTATSEERKPFSVQDLATFALRQRKERAAPLGQPKPKRRHRKTHGKIGFADLARTIAGNWKAMSDTERTMFQEYFVVETHRYRSELARWNTQVQERKAASQAALAAAVAAVAEMTTKKRMGTSSFTDSDDVVEFGKTGSKVASNPVDEANENPNSYLLCTQNLKRQMKKKSCMKQNGTAPVVGGGIEKIGRSSAASFSTIPASLLNMDIETDEQAMMITELLRERKTRQRLQHQEQHRLQMQLQQKKRLLESKSCFYPASDYVDASGVGVGVGVGNGLSCNRMTALNTMKDQITNQQQLLQHQMEKIQQQLQMLQNDHDIHDAFDDQSIQSIMTPNFQETLSPPPLSLLKGSIAGNQQLPNNNSTFLSGLLYGAQMAGHSIQSKSNYNSNPRMAQLLGAAAVTNTGGGGGGRINTLMRMTGMNEMVRNPLRHEDHDFEDADADADAFKGTNGVVVCDDDEVDRHARALQSYVDQSFNDVCMNVMGPNEHLDIRNSRQHQHQRNTCDGGSDGWLGVPDIGDCVNVGQRQDPSFARRVTPPSPKFVSQMENNFMKQRLSSNNNSNNNLMMLMNTEDDKFMSVLLAQQKQKQTGQQEHPKIQTQLKGSKQISAHEGGVDGTSSWMFDDPMSGPSGVGLGWLDQQQRQLQHQLDENEMSASRRRLDSLYDHHSNR